MNFASQENEFREYMKSYLDDFVRQYTADQPDDKYAVSEVFWEARARINSLNEEDIQSTMKQNGISAKCIVLDMLQHLAGDRISQNESAGAFYRLHMNVIDEKMRLGFIKAEEYALAKTIAEYMRSGGDLSDSCALRQFTQQRAQEFNSAAEEERKRAGGMMCLFGVVIFFVFVAIGLAVAGDPVSSEDPDQTQVDESQLTPIPIANGQIIDAPAEEALAPLSVVTQGKRSFYIVLEPIGDSGSPMSFFVRGDCEAEVQVPLGEYEIYYATGEDWYGKEALFGFNTAYFKCDETFLFFDDGEYYQGWTLELYTQSDGNLSTEYITAADFPG